MKSSIRSRFRVSIIKKQVMAITGLLLCGFLVSHLLGNLLLLKGDRAFNTYSHVLITNPFIIPVEIVLLIIFLVHVFLAIQLTWENKRARPIDYYMKKNTGRGATFASNTMAYTGVLILVFIVYHLINFKYGTHYLITYDGVEMRDLYKLLVEYYASPLNVLVYELAMITVGVHISHGFWSAFQSLGFNHPRYNKPLENFSTFFGVVIALGYMTLPIYCYLQGAR